MQLIRRNEVKGLYPAMDVGFGVDNTHEGEQLYFIYCPCNQKLDVELGVMQQCECGRRYILDEVDGVLICWVNKDDEK